MHGLKELLSFGKVRNKFLYFTLAIGIIPLILVGSISFVIATKNVRDSTTELFANNLDISNNIVNLLSRNMETLSRSVLGDQTIKNYMRAYRENPKGYLDARTVQSLDTLISDMVSDNSQFFSMFLLSEEGFKYQYTPFPYSAADLWKIHFQDISDKSWYQQTVGEDGKECYFLYDVLGEYAVQQNNPDCVSVTKLLKDTRTGETYGILVVNVLMAYFNEVYPMAIQSDYSCYLLADPKSDKIGYIGMQVGETDDLKEALGAYPDSFDSDHYIITHIRNQRTGWDLIHVIENAKLVSDGLTIPLITTIVILILILFSVFFSILAANTITRPLKQLNRLIERMEDRETAASIEFKDDEIGLIGKRFQMMIRQNEQLNQKITSLSLLEKEAELNALQAQINPHFFYNTLATMYWLAKFGKNSDVADMAISLSDIFKIALKRGNDMITVETEIEHIKKYINIQNIRYQNRIHFQLLVAPEMMQKKMLKLLLQPLVENAIYHGLETKTGDWELTVTGELKDSRMIFVVEDNGVGMTVDDSMPQGVGIQNVTERIRLKYGGEYGCQFESEPQKGTRVTVTIPDRDE